MVSYYEGNKREPSLDLLVEFAKFFNVSIDYLCGIEKFRDDNVKELSQSLPFNEKTIAKLFYLSKESEGLFEKIISLDSFDSLLTILCEYQNMPEEKIKIYKDTFYPAYDGLKYAILRHDSNIKANIVKPDIDKILDMLLKDLDKLQKDLNKSQVKESINSAIDQFKELGNPKTIEIANHLQSCLDNLNKPDTE
jgi:transcriptional regulator with XRE-family HTH domain